MPACSCEDYAPGVVIPSTGLDRRRTVSRLAFAIGILDLLAVVFLIIFYAVGRGAFGFGNDLANGVSGSPISQLDGAHWASVLPLSER